MPINNKTHSLSGFVLLCGHERDARASGGRDPIIKVTLSISRPVYHPDNYGFTKLKLLNISSFFANNSINLVEDKP